MAAQIEPPVQLEFIPSNRGKDLMIFDGHLFSNDKTSKDNTKRYWRCVEYHRYHCIARATTVVEGMERLQDHNDRHNHVPDVLKIRAKAAVGRYVYLVRIHIKNLLCILPALLLFVLSYLSEVCVIYF